MEPSTVHILPSEFKNATYWHETDLEPDDVLALLMLPEPTYVVVGEGNVAAKYHRAKVYYNLLGYHPFIMAGKKSNKPFHGDGEEFDPPLQTSWSAEDYGVLKSAEETHLRSFYTFAESENPVMISLKPMRELFDWYQLAEDEVTDLIGKVTLCAYGGFNFRCLLKRPKEGDQDNKDPDNSIKLCKFLTSFKRVVLYETYHALGQANSMNRQNGEAVYALLNAHREHPYVKALFKLTKLWNTHLVKQLEEEMSSRVEEQDRIRNQKAIDSIRGNEEFQYVMADFALAALLQSKEKSRYVDRLYIKNGYTTIDLAPEGATTHVEMYIGLDCGLKGVIAHIEEVLRRSLARLPVIGE